MKENLENGKKINKIGIKKIKKGKNHTEVHVLNCED